MKAEELKNVVREKYGQIARQSLLIKSSGCCCSGSGDDIPVQMIGEEYQAVKGYNPDADLKLGCGVPTEYSGISKGDHVLDLGSGAGNDCFIAAMLVGETGSVTGLDFSEDMLVKANKNLKKTGFSNIEFVHGDIENIPLKENSFDVVISNCVLNLVPDKEKAFSEIHRVLKPGGHFCISDVVLKGELPDKLKTDAESYAGCVSGALPRDEYLQIIESAGFRGTVVRQERKIELPGIYISRHFEENEVKHFNESGAGIYSITVTAIK